MIHNWHNTFKQFWKYNCERPTLTHDVKQVSVWWLIRHLNFIFHIIIHTNKSVLLCMNLSSLHRIQTTIFFHENQNYRTQIPDKHTYLLLPTCKHSCMLTFQPVLVLVGLKLPFPRKNLSKEIGKSVFSDCSQHTSLLCHSPHNTSNLIFFHLD